MRELERREHATEHHLGTIGQGTRGHGRVRAEHRQAPFVLGQWMAREIEARHFFSAARIRLFPWACWKTAGAAAAVSSASS